MMYEATYSILVTILLNLLWITWRHHKICFGVNLAVTLCQSHKGGFPYLATLCQLSKTRFEIALIVPICSSNEKESRE